MTPLLAQFLKRARRPLYKLRYQSAFFKSNTPADLAVTETDKLFPYFTSSTDILDMYNQYFQNDLEYELAYGKTICEHNFDFLSYPIQHGNQINWILDPHSKRNWKMDFCFDIPYYGPDRLGDIKLPWELNKHQYFFILGKLYSLTRNNVFRDEIISQINTWITDNPIYVGINWISGLEIAMRAISWIMVYPFIRKQITQTFYLKFINSLFTQIKFVRQNLSLSRYANNHLVGEAASLIICGLFLESPKSSKWISTGLEVLSSQINKQVYNDGVNKEQGMSYHRLFLDYYYLVLILLRRNNIPYPQIIDEKIEKMTDFILYSLKPNGSPPVFGDSDDARGVFVKPDCISDYTGLLSLGAVLFNRGDFKYAAGGLTQEVLWLLGTEGVENYLNLEPRPPSKLTASFEDAGYFILRTGLNATSNHFFFDCGPLGYGRGAHGHSDALSFQLFSQGSDYFIDTGTYSYNVDYEWRDYFRSTRAHNTITVDNLSQSEVKHRMAWRSKANAKCTFSLLTDWFDLIDAQHDGYMRLNDPVLHRRLVFHDKRNLWLLFDLLDCKAQHVFDFHLHLHPNCSPQIDLPNNPLKIISSDGKNLLVDFIQNHKDIENEIEIFRGDEKTKLGWFSGKYGSKVPTNTIRVRKKSSGRTYFTTIIRSSNNNSIAKFEHQANDSISISLQQPKNAIREDIYYSLSSSSQIASDHFSFHGKVFYIKELSYEEFVILGKNFFFLKFRDDLTIVSTEEISILTIIAGEIDLILPEKSVNSLKISCSEAYRVRINSKEFK